MEYVFGLVTEVGWDWNIMKEDPEPAYFILAVIKISLIFCAVFFGLWLVEGMKKEKKL